MQSDAYVELSLMGQRSFVAQDILNYASELGLLVFTSFRKLVGDVTLMHVIILFFVICYRNETS